MITEEWLEKKSFENMIYYYKEQLWQIVNGVMQRKVFTDSELWSLRRHGVFERVYGRAKRGGSRVILSDRAMRVLMSFE